MLSGCASYGQAERALTIAKNIKKGRREQQQQQQQKDTNLFLWHEK